MSPTQQLCSAVGLTVKQAAKRVGLSSRRLAEKINHGTPSMEQAELIEHVLRCDPLILIIGYRKWEKYQQELDTRNAVVGELIDRPQPMTRRMWREHVESMLEI